MRYVIGIGSNLGDSESSVRDAMDAVTTALNASNDQRSSLYRTQPVGGPEQPDYVNAVVILESEHPPLDVLALLQEIEQRAGRVRDVRWGPRTLDLDIIDVDSLESDDPLLTLPHPRAHERAFVLVPWHEIDSGAVLAGHGPIADIVERGFTDQDIERVPNSTGGGLL